MNFQGFLASLGIHEFTFWSVLVFLTSLGIEFTPKIKWNPWSAFFKWIGSRFNSKVNENVDSKFKEMNERLDGFEKKLDKVSIDLDQHVTESVAKELKDTRRDILEFCNSCMNRHRHTKEQFDFVLKQCDDYEKYIEENHIKNGVISAAIQEIRRLNLKCIQENSYLKEGKDYSHET